MASSSSRQPSPRLKIYPPTDELLPGRGFYQLADEVLYIQVTPFSKERRFFSYLESGQVRFDMDREGRLLFIEVSCPRHRWPTGELPIPQTARFADIRWLDFRSRMVEPDLVTNPSQTALLLRFADPDGREIYKLAESITLALTRESRLAAIWISEIVDDPCGQRIAAFRRRCRKEIGERPNLAVSY